MGDFFDHLFPALASQRDVHRPTCPIYAVLCQASRTEIERRFGPAQTGPSTFGPMGNLVFPYISMGAINSLDLFGLDELIIFSFYYVNRGRYRRVLDIGANIGLHSIIQSRCGFQVTCFEPDPVHYELLTRNLANNGCGGVEPVNAAVSTVAGTAEFVRVKGNTTGSHLAGAKPNPYGELDRFPVTIKAFAEEVRGADLVKMDVEGHEADILCATSAAVWAARDCMLEVGSEINADKIWQHFSVMSGVNLFAQMIGWERVTKRDDMPSSYKHGSLFITARPRMPWGED